MLGHFGGSPGGLANTVLYQGHPPLNLHYRPLQQSDHDALKAIHRELFPIDYEEVFFRKAVAGEDRVFSWAAFHSEYGRDHLVGFVTARVVYLYECDPLDRQVMGLNPRCLDGECAVYVLTLGVVPACRQCGIARSLLGLVHQHASRLRCRAIFLHVISYNDAAMRLYSTSGYQPMARLPNFYHLITGRQPNPDQSWYDAFLYAHFIPQCGPEPSPAMQWAGGVLGAAVAPLRSMLGSFNGCMPMWFCRACRQTYSTFLPFANTTTTTSTTTNNNNNNNNTTGVAASQRSASKGSLADTATSAWQQPQQRPPSPTSTQYQHLRRQSQSQVQHPHAHHHQQQPPLPPSTAAGTVCAGVTAEQFLKWDHQQQQKQRHLQAGHQQQQQQWCTRAELRQNGAVSSQVAAGAAAGGGSSSSGTDRQQYKTGSMLSYGLDSVGGGSSAASSPTVSGDIPQLQQQQQQQQTPLPRPPPPPPPPPALHVQSKRHLHHHNNRNHNNSQQQQQQQQQQQSYGMPVLRPPSPPIPPSLSPSTTSLQQRYPHSTGSGANAAPPPYAAAPGPQSAHHRSHHMAQQHLGSNGQQYGTGTSGGTHSRTGEHSRGGIHRGPQGMAGGGLHSHPLGQQQQQQQQSFSVLSALFRPPIAPLHPHSR